MCTERKPCHIDDQPRRTDLSTRMQDVPKIAAAFETARKVLDSDTADREAIMAACDVLAASEWWRDVIRVRDARARLGREVLETRPLSEDELIAGGAYLGPMAQHFEALETPADQRRRRGRFVVGLVFVGFVLAVVAHVAFAAPGKVARTVELYQQIEGN